jgi:hypothetical protein
MATPIKRIEKDFFLKILYDAQIPVMYYHDRNEYALVLENPVKDAMVFRPDRPIEMLKPGSKLELMFNYKRQILMFVAEVQTVKNECIFCDIPEFLYKNLDRSFSRIRKPGELEVRFSFRGDRYNLSYPTITEFEPETITEIYNNIDPRNLSGLISGMDEWLNGCASGHKLVMFKNSKPETVEERVIAETGKILYLPAMTETLPLADPHPGMRLVTEALFKSYLESTGVDEADVDAACSRFIHAKQNNGILSEAWVPVLFQEYVIGYIHIWIDTPDKALFTITTIEAVCQFAKVLAHSLKVNGYFEYGKLKNNPFEGDIIDISVSGLLFTYPRSEFSLSLLPDSDLLVQLVSPRRTVNANAKIVRCYRDSSMGYFGCSFYDMEPEDIRFLFEFLYGKPFADKDLEFFCGHV